jgi:hypothetical protein
MVELTPEAEKQMRYLEKFTGPDRYTPLSDGALQNQKRLAAKGVHLVLVHALDDQWFAQIASRLQDERERSGEKLLSEPARRMS